MRAPWGTTRIVAGACGGENTSRTAVASRGVEGHEGREDEHVQQRFHEPDPVVGEEEVVHAEADHEGAAHARSPVALAMIKAPATSTIRPATAEVRRAVARLTPRALKTP